MKGFLKKPFVRHGARAVRLTLMIAAVMLAVAAVTTLTIDLGPLAREAAERGGSGYLERPMHIGRLSFRLYTGNFVVEDLVIEGVTPADRPSLRAKRIEVSVSWSALAHREVLLESIEMTDWDMLTESFPGGRHTLPKFARGSRGGSRPRLVTTTLSYVRASRGQFTFEDHGAPWSTVARNLDVTVTKGVEYRGHAAFSGGTVTIGDHVPMSADLQMVFRLDGPMVQVEKLDLVTDGAVSAITGHVDLAHWPEQLWQVDSRVQFPRVREIFFRNHDWVLSGEGRFAGTFHIFKGGRELKGTFDSAQLGVYDLDFPHFRGALLWVPDRFEVTNGAAEMYGGRTAFTFSMAPLGKPAPARARFETRYQEVDLAAVTDAFEPEGLRLQGRASGRNLLEWPLDRFSSHTGEGTLSVVPPALVEIFDGNLRGPLAAHAGEPAPDYTRPLGYLAIAGETTYTYDPEWIEVVSGWLATSRTTVRFNGRTAYGDRARMPFEVVSADWQESDRVLAGVMTALGATTSPKPFGGRGSFEGVLSGSFRSPRIEGAFLGERMRAWDVVWGEGRANIAFENGYLDVADAFVVKDGARIEADGRFALGYPRRDGGDEWDARFRATDSQVAQLRHAFSLDEYDLDGRLSGEFHLYGRYEAPFGVGTMSMTDGVAYGETFERGAADLRFEGQGVRLSGLEIVKSGGVATGAAYIGFNGSYSFSLDGRRLPLEALTTVSQAELSLTGLVQFSASGTGTFDAPRYDVRARIDDLFWTDEGIGQVTGRLAVRGRLVTVELDAASPRLTVTGTGQVAFTPELDAHLTLVFTDTSLDPYVRPYLPRLSPFATAVGSGTIRIVGELANPEHLRVDGALDRLRLRLFDYALENAVPIRLALDGQAVRLSPTRLVGQDTELELAGVVDLAAGRIDGEASGRANLGVLQGFFRDIRSSGGATLSARISGALDDPELSGSATIAEGRLRHFAVPRSLESVNGRVVFDARGARVDGLTARLGGGDVQFGGGMSFDGYVPAELNLTASGRNMALRIPEGVSSSVDAELTLTGRVAAPLLSGTATVRRAVWDDRAAGSTTLDDLTGVFRRVTAPAATGSPAPSAFPLQFDVRILAPGTLEVRNSTVQGAARVDVTLRGTYDRPLLFGQGEVVRGVLKVEGRRYLITRGALDFTNPARIDPFIDVEAETNVRQPGQTYRVTVRAAGTVERLNLSFASDPSLPEVAVVAMLLGDVQASQDAELQALQQPNLSEQELIKARAARLLGSPVLSEVGRVVEQTFGVDTFQITPQIGSDPLQQSARFTPSARLTIVKQVSDRVYMTYARSLSSPNRDQIVLIEFDQTDRLSWIFTRNEDETYSLDFRVRGAF